MLNGAVRMTQAAKQTKPKYVSPKRAEPRVTGSSHSIFDEAPDKNLASNVDPKSGYLPFRISAPSFLETFTAAKDENRRLITEKHSSCISRLRRIIELQYRIASCYFWIIDGIPYAEPNQAYRVLIRTFAANLVSVNAALELTLDGVYSNARPLMRYAYEGSMIAKLCAVDPSTEVFDKWLDGEYIRFTQDVLNRIAAPKIDEFKTLWSGLSESTHASFYSGQPDLSNAPALNEASLNLIFLHVLLEANDHILRSHIVNSSLRYYQKNWSTHQGLPDDVEELRSLLTTGKVPWMGKSARRFIRDFRRTWVVR